MRTLPHYVIAIACLVGAVGIMQASGIGAALGVAPETGVESNVEALEGDLEEVQSDQRGVDSIIGLAISAVGLGIDMVGIVLFFPYVLGNLGVPGEIAVALSLPVYAVAMFFVISVLRGVGVL